MTVGWRYALGVLLGGVVLVLGSAASARVNPPMGTVSPGEELTFSLALNDSKFDVRLDERSKCTAEDGPMSYKSRFQVFPGGLGPDKEIQHAASNGASGFSFSFTVPAGAQPGGRYVVDMYVFGGCGLRSAYSATAQWGPYEIGAPAKQTPAKPKTGAKVTCTGPSKTHTRLMREPWKSDPRVLEALRKAKAGFQSNKEEAGEPFAFDEFAITIEEMPPGLTPQQLLAQFARDPNGTVKDAKFNFGSSFHRRGTGEPQVGEIYDIDIPFTEKEGGSVMLVEKQPDHFILQTIVTAKKGRHPVSGARQFGFTKNTDGSVTLYTRGADRPDVEKDRALGRQAQGAVWTGMMEGLARQIRAKGGKVRERVLPSSNGARLFDIRKMRKDLNVGC